MLTADRTIMRNLLLVLVGSTAATLAIGVSCLGRGQLEPVNPRPGVAVSPRTLEQPPRGSVRSSAGGVTSEPQPDEPVGTTTLTGQDLDRGASATGTPTVTTGFRSVTVPEAGSSEPPNQP